MVREKELLTQMGTLLDQLIQISGRMNQLAAHALSEPELNELQDQQSAWMEELIALDEKCHELEPSDVHVSNATLRERNRQKIIEFEKLNNTFIENIANGHGLIRFEEKSKKAKPKGTKKVS
jgi:hypothetical protein